MKSKRRNDKKIIYGSRKNNNVENKKWILYTDIIKKKKNLKVGSRGEQSLVKTEITN